MLVSHRHRFIYTKTVKTGGTSVEAYFEPFCVDDPSHVAPHYRDESVCASGVVGYRGLGPPPRGCRWWNHMPAATIKRRLGDALWGSYFKFCVVRNPYDKAISQFYFHRSIGRFAIDRSLPDALQFEQWLATPLLAVDRNKYTIEGKFCLDRVIRHERLDADLQETCAHLGVAWDAQALPRLKAGFRPASASIASMYTPATARASSARNSRSSSATLAMRRTHSR